MVNRYLETTVTETDVTEPVTLEQAKSYLTVTTSDYDDLITDLITVARKKVEAFAHVSLVVKTVVCIVEAHEYRILLPFPKVDEITTVEVLQGINTDGTLDWEELDLADGDYSIIGTEFKSIYIGDSAKYRITYTTLPYTQKDIVLDVKRVCNWLFRNRGDEVAVMPNELFSNAQSYKIHSWG